MKTLPHPKDLDRQCSVSICKWIDLFSEEARNIDPDHKLSVEWYKMLTKEPADLYLDANGRIWGVSNNGIYFPYHFSYGNQLIGYKISSKAAN
jgi:hypothetical protein